MIKILLLADTHLGFDDPIRPRVERRRRGPDFFANYARALEPARAGQVDLVVHGGDLFFRSRVHESIVHRALEPLAQLAAQGMPVFLVPGNHERSRIPLHLLRAQRGLHIFDEPRTFWVDVQGMTIALVGFPFDRDARSNFKDQLARARSEDQPASVRLLCMHQTVEGAQVGPSGYTFREGRDVIRGRDLPTGFQAALCGHIHRAQVLREDLSGDALPYPVLYPGSVERTSFAEREEEKGYMILEIGREQGRVSLCSIRFVPLPTRSMLTLDIDLGEYEGLKLRAHLLEQLGGLDPDAVVRLRFQNLEAASAQTLPTTRELRALAPVTMNVSVSSFQER
jgi:DNA repair exonuclease SbcCD nuclease subunit